MQWGLGVPVKLCPLTAVVAIVGPGCLRQSHKGEKWPQMLGRAIWVPGMLLCEWVMVGGDRPEVPKAKTHQGVTNQRAVRRPR